jgi:hypothetical protein
MQPSIKVRPFGLMYRGVICHLLPRSSIGGSGMPGEARASESSLHTVLSIPDLELSNNFVVADPGLLFTLARARVGVVVGLWAAWGEGRGGPVCFPAQGMFAGMCFL